MGDEHRSSLRFKSAYNGAFMMVSPFWLARLLRVRYLHSYALGCQAVVRLRAARALHSLP